MFNNDTFQYYPTPEALAKRAWSMFKHKIIRVLEPSAGEGHLAAANDYNSRWRQLPIDVIEIDLTKHARLREQGFNIVGVDFLEFQNGAIYSSFLLNPPFAQGVEHVLKAWNIAYEAEIVAIINAESIRNPYTKERKHLVDLIEKHGTVEYVIEAFAGDDAERKTEVEIALVYLKKSSNFAFDLKGNILDQMKKDDMTASGLAGEYKELHSEVALSNSFIENAVAAHRAALLALKQAVFARARAEHYLGLVGDTMARMNGDAGQDMFDSSLNSVRENLYEGYKDLQDRSWANILRSTTVTSKMSSEAQKRMESQFEDIKKLEFSVANIYGFLAGLSASRGEIQMQMALDVFDEITRYHTDNAVFYMGWKSNSKHRTGAFRIKMTRFILPRNSSHSTGLSWEANQRLDDFDKVMAMLDGKPQAQYGMRQAFDDHWSALRNGERITTTYFDVRYYQGIGTVHFFPRNAELIDRLNRLVGMHRQWLPPEGQKVSEDFWLQYKSAEKFDKEIRAEVRKHATSRWDNPLWGLTSQDEETAARASQKAGDAVAAVLAKRGINVELMLEDLGPETLLLTAA
jgi:hypothetical protein